MTVEETVQKNRIYEAYATLAVEIGETLGLLHAALGRDKEDPLSQFIHGEWREDTKAEIREAYLRGYKEGEEECGLPSG